MTKHILLIFLRRYIFAIVIPPNKTTIEITIALFQLQVRAFRFVRQRRTDGKVKAAYRLVDPIVQIVGVKWVPTVQRPKPTPSPYVIWRSTISKYQPLFGVQSDYSVILYGNISALTSCRFFGLDMHCSVAVQSVFSV